MEMTRSSRRKMRRHEKRLLGVVLLAALAAVLLAAVLLSTVFRAAEKTLPDRVQKAIPEWVEQQFLPQNEYSRPGIAVTEVNNIVVHYVGNPGTSAAANRSYFENLATTHETYASSNFIVGLEGEVLQCVPVNEVAYCSNNRNDDTVSIEVCHPDAEGEFSEETMDSLVELTAWLCDAFGLEAEDVIRHYDVTGKECPIYYVRHPEAWEAFKEAVQEKL